MTHFRGVSWGARQAEVIAAESTTPLMQTSEVLAFDAQVAGFASHLFYTFRNDALVDAFYIIDSRDDEEDVEAFTVLADMLEAKYGAPEANHRNYNPRQTGDMSSLSAVARAVAVGAFEGRLSWDMPETFIQLGLCGDTQRINAYVILKYWDQSQLRLSPRDRHSTEFDKI